MSAQTPSEPASRKRANGLPDWLTKRLPVAPAPAGEVRRLLSDLHLDTVCRGARCPNQCECYQRRRATFLLLGPNCTRTCRFCALDRRAPAPVDADEPERVARAAARLGLRHAVVTSVTRDDLPDGGAAHFAATVAAIRRTCPGATIEILTPDFAGDQAAWAVAADAAPDVFNHNLETIARLYPQVRPQADYGRSLELLAFVKARRPELLTKSGLMVGLGEELPEILSAARDLRTAGVDMITIGQYLKSAPENLPVARFVTPQEFSDLEPELQALGFAQVACGPFVRSSYNAEECLEETKKTME